MSRRSKPPHQRTRPKWPLPALFGAVLSTLDSLLNSASTIFTMDIYSRYSEKEHSPKSLVKVGRIATLLLVIVGCVWAPIVGSFDSLYDYIQKFWGLIQPGILAAFLFGILWKKVPSQAVIGGMILNVPVYGALLLMDEFLLPADGKIAFLHYMMITFVIVCIYITVVTLRTPQQAEATIPVKFDYDVRLSPVVKVWSALIFLSTVALYWFFR
ncbi:MAG: hypothetical protein GC178_11090 [Flavobacteriales bacterium]|nr:hypothetical protein [Flavobacteriales bacterium]